MPLSGPGVPSRAEEPKSRYRRHLLTSRTHAPPIESLCRADIGAIVCEKPIAYDLRAAERAVAARNHTTR
jgi:hypothetical protein